MLKQLRNKKVARRIFIVLALIIIPAFVLWGTGSMSRTKTDSEYAGAMFGKKISNQEYGTSWRAVKNEALMRYPNFNEIYEQLDLNSQAWDRLILLAEASKERIKVSDEDVIKAIRGFPFLSVGGKFDVGLYERLLKNTFQTSPRDFEEDMRSSMKISKLISKAGDGVHVPDEELLRKYKEENDKIKILYVTLSPKDFADKADVSEKDIEDYYKANASLFKMPERVNIEFVEFKYSDYLAGIEITDNEISQYYASHIKEFEHTESVRARHILTADANLAANVLKKIKDGGDFAEMAKQYSEDTAKETGGDLGYFEKGKMIPEFESAVFALKPGEVSNIVKTQFGYHIIKVEDRKPAYTESLDDAKTRIKDKIATEQAKVKAYSEALRARNTVEKDTDFEKVAQEYKKPLKKTGYFSKQEFIPAIGWNSQLLKAAFNLKINEVSPLISPNNVKSEANYIIKVIDKKEPGIPPLDEIKNMAKETVKQNKMNALAKKSMEESNELITAKMKGGLSFKEAAESAGLKVKESEYITRMDYINDIGPAMDVKDVFEYKAGGISPVLATPRTVCIIQLEELKSIEPAKFEEAKKEFKEKSIKVKKAETLDKWFSGLKSRAEVQSNLP